MSVRKGLIARRAINLKALSRALRVGSQRWTSLMKMSPTSTQVACSIGSGTSPDTRMWRHLAWILSSITCAMAQLRGVILLGTSAPTSTSNIVRM